MSSWRVIYRIESSSASADELLCLCAYAWEMKRKIKTHDKSTLDTWLAETVKTNRNAVTRMWYKLSQMAKRLRSDINDRRARKGDNYDAEARERELMLRRIEDIRDRFGRALVQAKKQGTKSGNAALSARGVDKKSQEMYNKWRWATDNGLLTSTQMKELQHAFNEVFRLNYEFAYKTPDGRAMIELADDNGVGNTIAFVSDEDGLYISQIYKLNVYNETDASDERSKIYALERQGIPAKVGGILQRYTKANKRDQLGIIGGSKTSNGNNGRPGAVGDRSTKEASRADRQRRGGEESYSISAAVEPISSDVYQQMEEHFGTTRNYDVAGYLLPDGKMLDFDGRR